MDIATTWYILSILLLFTQSIRDLVRTKVDERYNYMLFGYALFAFFASGGGLKELLFITVTTIVVGVALRGTMGKGDHQALTALLLGNYAVGSITVFLALLAFGVLVMAVNLRLSGLDRAPFYPVLAVIQLTTAVLA